MQAISVIPDKQEVRILDHGEPSIERGTHVKIQTLEVGVCGTDREICSFEYGTPPAGADYLVLGHESLGKVVEVGSGVSNLKPGDLVSPSVRRPCSDASCSPCREELQDFCVRGDFTERGIKMAHGYMTEYFVEDEAFLFSVDESLRDVGVLTEPLTIAEKAISQVLQLQKRMPWGGDLDGDLPGAGLRAVVIGAGPIGILGAMALKVRGFDVSVYSRSKAPVPKSELLESIGVPYYSALEITPQELAEQVGNIDFVYEAVGVAESAFGVLEVLGTNGAYVFTGIPAAGDPIAVHGRELMRNMVLKNQLIVGTVNADANAFKSAIADLAKFQQRWPAALAKVISGRFGLDSYEALLVGKSTGIKNVIQFG
jgi:threonine dehydrogenase-like Zn-dependent dehydrogenase